MAIDLKKLTKQPSEIRVPPQLIIYAGNGLGKSTIGAPSKYGIGAPNPVYMNTNNRINHLSVAGNDMPLHSYEDCQEFLRYVLLEPHDFKTLFVDTVDDTERLVFTKVASDAGKAVIGDIGYSKGYEDALSEWEKILKMLTLIRDKRGMTIVCLAQEDVRKHKNADGDDYEIIVPKLHGSTTKGDSTLALFTAWADGVYRLKNDVYTKVDNSGFVDKKAAPKLKAVANGGLYLYTKNNPAFRAKDTFELPEKIDASYGLWQSIENGIDEYWKSKEANKASTVSEKLPTAEKEVKSTTKIEE